ncbi:hypothetical protein JBW_02696 [Pelosinus fermentans JBW45]|uniref:Uncharacterized protein n=1 Tax=Pelosinus fermentans JBW45 TaxID=1192197 RepID=I8U195_9FIRM|nr:hypothetical protein JBW_02696 [Pelosinus fermentans JBW45]
MNDAHNQFLLSMFKDAKIVRQNDYVIADYLLT